MNDVELMLLKDIRALMKLIELEPNVRLLILAEMLKLELDLGLGGQRGTFSDPAAPSSTLKQIETRLEELRHDAQRAE